MPQKTTKPTAATTKRKPTTKRVKNVEALDQESYYTTVSVPFTPATEEEFRRKMELSRIRERQERLEDTVGMVIRAENEQFAAEENYHEIDTIGIKGFESYIVVPKSKKEYVNQISHFQKVGKEIGYENGVNMGIVLGVIAACSVFVPFLISVLRERNAYAEAYSDLRSEMASIAKTE